MLLVTGSPYIKKTVYSYKDINRVVNKFKGISSIKFYEGEIYSEQGSPGVRLALLKIAKQHFLTHPFFGIGRGSFLYHNKYRKKAHNNYVQMFAETGFLGGFSFILLTITVFKYLFSGFRVLENKAFWFFLLNSFLVLVINLAVDCYIQLKMFWVFIIPFAVYAKRECDQKREKTRSLSA